MPGWGLSQKLSRAIGIYRAKELSLTGNYLSAEQAAAWGLVNRVVAPDELLPTCHALARDMLSCDPVVHALATSASSTRATRRRSPTACGSRTRRHAPTPARSRAESIATRRAGVQARGREQKG